LSLIAVESLTNAVLGAVSGLVVDVVQSVPPLVFVAVQSTGKAGAVTPSKFWLKATPQGGGVPVAVAVAVAVTVAVEVAVAVAVAVAVGVGEGVPVEVAVAVGVGEGVPSPLGAWIATVIGEPVLKKPTVAFTACGGVLESKRKL